MANDTEKTSKTTVDGFIVFAEPGCGLPAEIDGRKIQYGVELHTRRVIWRYEGENIHFGDSLP